MHALCVRFKKLFYNYVSFVTDLKKKITSQLKKLHLLKNAKTETERVIARIHFKQETIMCVITKHYILNRRSIFSTFFFRFCVAQKLLFFVDFQSRRKKIALGSMNKNKPFFPLFLDKKGTGH
jgi:hypothetical protein